MENMPGQAALADPGRGLRYVARQPILDLQGRVFGYELLFRNSLENTFQGDGELATRTMLDNTVLFGLDKLTSGTMAFVNCTHEALTQTLVDILPPEQTILEILEDLEPTPELIEACRRLKEAGYRLALDDFEWRPDLQPLVELAAIIKVDILKTPEPEWRQLMRQVRESGLPITMLAEKVETYEAFENVRTAGFTLFQGYYFCRPVLLKTRAIPANHLSHIEILRLLREVPLDMEKLATAVKRNASLTYRLLRLVNSPLYAMRQEVRSVKTALVAIGEDAFRRLATLAIASEMNSGQSIELLRMAFVRARFCELASEAVQMDATEQYLVGLLSLLPAMLRVPMKDLLPSLPLREEVHEALLGETVPEGRLLRWIEGCEQGDWKACDEQSDGDIALEKQLHDCYHEALLWAEQALPFA